MLTYGFSANLYPESREEFLQVIDEQIKSYHYLETAVVDKAKVIIDQMKKEGVWVEDVNYDHIPKPTVVLFPGRNIPYDIEYSNGYLDYKLILPMKEHLGEDNIGGISAQYVLLSFAKPFSLRCKEEKVYPSHLPLCLKTTDFEKEAAEYIDEILDCHVVNFTHMSAKDLAVVFEEKLGEIYQNHEKTYGAFDEKI